MEVLRLCECFSSASGVEYLPYPPSSFPVVPPLIAPTHNTPGEEAFASLALSLPLPSLPPSLSLSFIVLLFPLLHSLSSSHLPSGAAVTWSSLVWNYSLPYRSLCLLEPEDVFFVPTPLCLSHSGTCHISSLTPLLLSLVYLLCLSLLSGVITAPSAWWSRGQMSFQTPAQGPTSTWRSSTSVSPTVSTKTLSPLPTSPPNSPYSTPLAFVPLPPPLHMNLSPAFKPLKALDKLHLHSYSFWLFSTQAKQNKSDCHLSPAFSLSFSLFFSLIHIHGTDKHMHTLTQSAKPFFFIDRATHK